MNMEKSVKILTITALEEHQDGPITAIYGLGDDGKVYYWSTNQQKWRNF